MEPSANLQLAADLAHTGTVNKGPSVARVMQVGMVTAACVLIVSAFVHTADLQQVWAAQGMACGGVLRVIQDIS
jgi:hypothetical protein